MAAILPKGKRAIAIDIAPDTSAAGFILPNDHVDVILARRDDKDADKAAGADAHTGEIILSNIRVLAIDQTVEDKNGQRVVVGKTATLELSPHQSEMLARAKLMGVAHALAPQHRRLRTGPATTTEQRRRRGKASTSFVLASARRRSK